MQLNAASTNEEERVVVAVTIPLPATPLIRSVDHSIGNLQRVVVLLILCLILTWARIFHRMNVIHAMNNADLLFDTAKQFQGSPTASLDGPLRILYIVTTSMEYNTGRKARILGTDRLMKIVVPVIQDSVESMIDKGYDVDVFLLTAYNLTEEREQTILSLLPDGTGLEVWSDAIPYDYDLLGRVGSKFSDRLYPVGRTLARQHRFVVRDKLFHYDLFLAFEDDMRITGDHIEHHLWLNSELDRLRQEAPDTFPSRQDNFFGQMTKSQLKRFKPGFLRVEVMLDEFKYPFQKFTAPVAVDLDFSDLGLNASESLLDPTICCHTKHVGLPGVPRKPNDNSIMLWETTIAGITLREMPPSSSLGWVGLLSGPLETNRAEAFAKYTGNTSSFVSRDPRLLAQSAGWILTRKEILNYHVELCMGGFLPPFNTPTFEKDGLYLNNVEYWSGGIQMWCPKNGCNIRRIITLSPSNFSKHLLYHTANNKQIMIEKNRRVKANTLLGQLNTYRKDATASKLKILKGNVKSSLR